MVTNFDLAELLDQQVTRYRPTESTTNMTTTLALSSAGATGIAAHLQPKDPNERATEYGYEEEHGEWNGWFSSTADIQTGDLLKATSGPHSGNKYWVRGLPDNTDISGIAHKMADLEYTEEST